MTTPDLNRLKVFYHIFQEKSVAGAARQLHVTQSAVSQHLQKLEAELKVQLFVRLHKRLVPTAAADNLFQVFKPFVDHLEDAVYQIRRARSGPAGTLRLGAPAAFGEQYLPGIFSDFRRIHPDVNFHLELGHPTILMPRVGEGLLDFAFADIFSEQTPLSREMAVFSIRTVVLESLVLACSKGYFKDRIREDPSFENLGKCTFIAYHPQAPAVRNWFRHHLDKTTVHPDIALSVESVRAVITAMKEGLGLGVVPAHSIRAELKTGELVLVETGRPEMVNRISLVQLQDRVPGPAEKAFLNFFKDAMTEAAAFQSPRPKPA